MVKSKLKAKVNIEALPNSAGIISQVIIGVVIKEIKAAIHCPIENWKNDLINSLSFATLSSKPLGTFLYTFNSLQQCSSGDTRKRSPA